MEDDVGVDGPQYSPEETAAQRLSGQFTASQARLRYLLMGILRIFAAGFTHDTCPSNTPCGRKPRRTLAGRVGKLVGNFGKIGSLLSWLTFASTRPCTSRVRARILLSLRYNTTLQELYLGESAEISDDHASDIESLGSHPALRIVMTGVVFPTTELRHLLSPCGRKSRSAESDAFRREYD